MSKADKLGGSASFGQAKTVSARRAAIGAATGAPTAGLPDPTRLPVDAISQNPDNPRDELRDLDSLTQSVKESGVVTAITVARVEAYLRERPDRADELDKGAKYLVVDGHRRLEAARRAGLKEIKVTVDDDFVASDESLLEAAFVANFHNDNMTDLEQAHALQRLVEFYGSQSKASKRLGISQPTISAKLSLLKLSPELQADLAAGRRQVEHVRNLGKLSHAEQRKVADARRAEAEARRDDSGAQARSSEEPLPGAADAYQTPDTADARSPKAPPLPQSASQPANESAEPSGPSKAGAETQPARGGVSTSKQTAPKRDVVSPTSMPWDDPQAVVRIAQEHMTQEDFRTTAKLWQQATEAS